MNELKKIDEALGKILDQNPEMAAKIRQGKKEKKSIESIILQLGDDLVRVLLGEK